MAGRLQPVAHVSADEFVLIGALLQHFAATIVRLQRRNALNARKDPHGKPVG